MSKIHLENIIRDIQYLREDYLEPQISVTSLDPSFVICESEGGTSEGIGIEDWS